MLLNDDQHAKLKTRKPQFVGEPPPPNLMKKRASFDREDNGATCWQKSRNHKPWEKFFFLTSVVTKTTKHQISPLIFFYFYRDRINFTNVLQAALCGQIPKAQIGLGCLFELWGSAIIKAALKHAGEIDPWSLPNQRSQTICSYFLAPLFYQQNKAIN